MYGSWIALCFGLLLLFLSALTWMDFRQIFNEKNPQDSMSEYLIVGKMIANEKGAQNRLFTNGEIDEIKAFKNVRGVGSLTANQFPVAANIGGNLGFHTELFLEAVDNSFLDNLPQNWSWQPGQNTVPILISNDFLNLYNYGFALSQGLPQLSQKSIQALPFQIVVNNGMEKFNAEIVGFTDRINSILVPELFMQTMNEKYDSGINISPSRIIIKVKDPSDHAFVALLKEKNYTVNADQLRWSRIRTAVQTIISIVGGIALLIVGMGILSFVLFLEITVFRAEKHIQLLKQIGYAPWQLKKILIHFFLPWMSSAVLMAAVVALGLQMIMLFWLKNRNLELRMTDAWILLVLMLFFLVILYLLLNKSTKNILRKI